jgi:hypothetical protein
MPTRRLTLLLPLLAACGDSNPPMLVPPGPLSYAHLTPLRLRVAEVEVLEADPPLRAGDLGRRLSPSPAEAVRIMARDRLAAFGQAGTARFRVTRALLVVERDALICEVGCRLDVATGAEGTTGYVEAIGRARFTGRDADRPRAPEVVMRNAMDELNVEFEFQLRRSLRELLVEGAGPEGGAVVPPPEPIQREVLPRE